MKKLLIALAALSVTTVFAAEMTTTTTTTKETTEETTNVSFDNTTMKCGNHDLSDGLNSSQLKKMKCKGFKNKKTDYIFTDDNSHKTVDCQVDQHGEITLTKCTSI